VDKFISDGKLENTEVCGSQISPVQSLTPLLDFGVKGQCHSIFCKHLFVIVFGKICGAVGS